MLPLSRLHGILPLSFAAGRPKLPSPLHALANLFRTRGEWEALNSTYGIDLTGQTSSFEMDVARQDPKQPNLPRAIANAIEQQKPALLDPLIQTLPPQSTPWKTLKLLQDNLGQFSLERNLPGHHSAIVRVTYTIETTPTPILVTTRQP